MLRAALCFVLALVTGTAQTFPSENWESASPAESVGYRTNRLAAIRPFLETLDTTAMVVVSRGKVVFEYGDLKTVSYLASCRKSVLAMLYGNYVQSGKVQLNKTIGDLGIDDEGGLLPIEKTATVEHLLTARSGVYHQASNAGDALGSAPPRGSQKPGTYQLYSNWDFNAAGTAFEKMTGRDIYEALESDLVRPIGMQDFDRALHKKSGDLSKSLHPAYHMHFSTRDMARLGYLMLRKGNWNGKQLVPEEWTRKITSLVTPVIDLNPRSATNGFASGTLWGYGYMWWPWDDHQREGPFRGAYSARGAVGQYIVVLPALDTVVAHKTVPGRHPDGSARGVSGQDFQTVLAMIASAYCGQCGRTQ
ncbi:MAG: serine hydrolase [Bryobacterales bacterium]|nr:serine hydrolase [Bryobacterales bacterium]